MKKTFAILLALIMVLSLATTAFAAGTTYSISVTPTDSANHTYEAYQIFAGDLDGSTLSNIVWGANVSDDGKTALQTKYGATDAAGVAAALNTSNAKEFAAEVAKYLTGTPAGSANTVTDGKYVISGLDAGYYLVKDKDGSLEGTNASYTAYILEVVKDVTVTAKAAMPTVDKQVKDEVGDAESGAVDGWADTADHAINESFQFKLTATLPADANFDAYTTYQVKFTDTMSEGITFESIASVTVDGVPINAADYTLTATEGQEGGSWTLTIADIKAIAGVNLTDGAAIVVTYNAHLNEKADITTSSETTTTNQNKVVLEYSNNPNGTGTGKTNEDAVWVFTYEIQNTKIDGGTHDPLANAGFRLYTDSNCTVEFGLIYDTTLSAYRPVKGAEVAEEMKSAADGKFNIVGLDAGTYYLKETTTPAGYNTCDVVTVIISAEHDEQTDGTPLVALGASQNTINTIENNAGSVLPSTGGIGTTMFYVFGSMMVVGAAVVLVTKKRMTAAE